MQIPDNPDRNFFESVKTSRNSAAALVDLISTQPAPSRAAERLIALERDAAITVKMLDGLEMPEKSFKGFAHFGIAPSDLPEPNIIAECIGRLGENIRDADPIRVTLSIVDRLLGRSSFQDVMDNISLVGHPRYTIQALYVRARAAIGLGDWESAHDELRLLQQISPHCAEMYWWIGNYYCFKNDGFTAAENFDAEFSFPGPNWMRRTVETPSALTANENYRGYIIQFINGEYVAAPIGKQKVIDLLQVRAVKLVQIVTSELWTRLCCRFGLLRAHTVLKGLHLHEVMREIDRTLD